MKILIDTCVLLDFLFQRGEGGLQARDVFVWASQHGHSLYLASKQMSDLYYIVHQHSHDKAATAEAMKSLLSFIEVLDTTGPDTVIALADQGPDYEDNILIEVAERQGMNALLSQDSKGFLASPIPAYTPTAFLKKFASSAH